MNNRDREGGKIKKQEMSEACCLCGVRSHEDYKQTYDGVSSKLSMFPGLLCRRRPEAAAQRPN